MDTTIGADAARLAGLQVDLLQEIRRGHITLEHIGWFVGLTKAERDAFALGEKPAPKPAPRPKLPVEKFALLADLGVITVPKDYDHATRLGSFVEAYRKKFYYYNDAIMDVNFPAPSRVLKPGDRLHVRAWKQIVRGRTTSAERMEFCRGQDGNVWTGAQGASLVWEEKRDELPKGYWYASLDEPDRLWEDADGNRRVPDVGAYSSGDFNFFLGSFERDWRECNAFFSFCDVPTEEAGE